MSYDSKIPQSLMKRRARVSVAACCEYKIFDFEVPAAAEFSSGLLKA